MSGQAALPGRADAKEQLEEFLCALYRPGDLVEIRPIEIWVDESGRKRSRILRQHRIWKKPDQIVQIRSELVELNEREHVNIFVGVNPRPRVGTGKKDDIQLCRSVWADLDHIDVEQASERWESIGLPQPSILVQSGTGIHAYWLLEQPYSVSCRSDRERFELMLQVLYRDLGSDSTNDLSRLLRLPGFLNVKNVRSGNQPRECLLLECNALQTYALDVFSVWLDQAESTQEGIYDAQFARRTTVGLHDSGAEVDVGTLVQNLDRPVRDRSRRDYAVVCELLRAGLTGAQIWALVHEKSKFRTNGRAYFETTIANSVRKVFP